MNNAMPVFSSVFASTIERYILEKRGMGLSYNTIVKVLAEFDRFIITKGYTRLELTKELMESWATQNPNHKARTTQHKLIIIREFARYMQRLGLSACADFELPKVRYTFVPYIFTDDELKRLFEQADTYVPLTKTTHKQLVVPVFLRLLYYCGLRLSDARSLLVNDVNLQDGILHIRKGKFNKERLVPMSPSVTEICRNYMKTVHPNPQPGAVFLPNTHGKAISKNSFYKTFRKLLLLAGIPHGGRGYGPRLHDLRHTYAVHRLRDWVREGADMNVMLPYLSAYLGHNSLMETEEYLRLTPDLFPGILEKMENEFSDLIPEIGSVVNADN